MKTVSNEFKLAAIAPVKESEASITAMKSDGTQAVYSASDALQSISIEASGELFGTYASTATITLLGTNYDDLLNADLDILFSLIVEGSAQTIDYGHFFVSDIKADYKKQTTTIKSISQMMKLQEASYTPIEGFPMTVEQMTNKIAESYGLNQPDMTGLPNIDQVIEEELYGNISTANYRNILAEIAGTTGTMALIDKIDNTLTFRPYQSTVQQTMDFSYLKSYTEGLHYGPTNSLVLSRLPQEDNVVVKDDASIAQYGLTEVKLANNEIMDDDRPSFAPALFDAVKNMEWTGFEIETVGLGWLECGDRISITDDNSNTIEGIITYIKLTFDGGIKETIKGIPPIATTTNYALAGGITKTIYNTEIKVDKQNQEIQSVVESQSEFENTVQNNFTNITQNINSVVTSVQASGGNNLIRNSAFFASDDSGRFLDWDYGTPSVILPPEYQQVNYIQSDGKQYIQSGINPSTLSDLEINTTAQFTEDSLGWKTICGISQGGDKPSGTSPVWVPQINFGKRGNDLGTIMCEYGDTENILDSGVRWDKDIHAVSVSLESGNSTITVDGVLEDTNTASITAIGPDGNMDIFGRTFANPQSFYDDHINMFASAIKLYSLDFSTGGNQIRNYIPCYRLSDRRVGLYDTINNTFNVNQWNEEDFTAGQAVGLPIVEPSGEAMAYGSLSGQIIHLENTTITQTIPVNADNESIPEDEKIFYSFNCRVKKASSGTAYIELSDGTAEGVWTINLANGEDYLWQEFAIDAILPNSTELTLTAHGSSDSDFQITDMMLCVGNYHSQWQQASGESNNTQVSITGDGITVKNGNLASSWVKHTSLDLEVYEDRRIASSLTGEAVSAPSGRFTKDMEMPPIKIVAQSDGWAFTSMD